MILELKHRMTSYTRFDATKRAHLLRCIYYGGPVKQWRIAGGISFFHGERRQAVWVHVPPNYVYAGPVMPFRFIEKLEPTHPLFKPGIIHSFLREQGKVKVHNATVDVDDKFADLAFLEAMRISGIPWFTRMFYFTLARLTPKLFNPNPSWDERMDLDDDSDFEPWTYSDEHKSALGYVDIRKAKRK